MASAGRGGGGRPWRSSWRVGGHGGSPRCPRSPGSTRRPARERQDERGADGVGTNTVAFIYASAAALADASSSSPACRSLPQEHRELLAVPGMGRERSAHACRGIPAAACAWRAAPSPGCYGESPLHKAARETAPLLLFAQREPGCREENGGVGVRAPHRPAWLAGRDTGSWPTGRHKAELGAASQGHRDWHAGVPTWS